MPRFQIFGTRTLSAEARNEAPIHLCDCEPQGQSSWKQSRMADVNRVTVASAAFVVLAGLLQKRQKKCWWMISLYRNRLTTRGPSFLENMVEEEDNGHFRNFTRMSSTDFNFLLESICDNISRKDTNFRKAITPEEKLAITLRFWQLVIRTLVCNISSMYQSRLLEK